MLSSSAGAAATKSPPTQLRKSVPFGMKEEEGQKGRRERSALSGNASCSNVIKCLDLLFEDPLHAVDVTMKVCIRGFWRTAGNIHTSLCPWRAFQPSRRLQACGPASVCKGICGICCCVVLRPSRSDCGACTVGDGRSWYVVSF